MCVSSVDHPPGGIAFSLSTHDANLPYACNTRSLEVQVHKPQCRKNTLSLQAPIRPQLQAQAREHAPQNGIALVR